MKTLLALLLLIPSLSWGVETKLFKDWVVAWKVDEFSDNKSIIIMTNTNLNNEVGNSEGSSMHMSIDRDGYKNIYNLTVHFDAYVCGDETNDEEVSTKFRVDKNEPFELQLENSPSKENGNLWMYSKKSKKLIDEIFLGNSLRVRVYDEICGKINNYSFPLKGFNEAYEYALTELN